MSMVGRRAFAGVVVAAAVASGAVIARADDAKPRASAAEGGLKAGPVMIERTAAAGAISPPLTISNNSSKRVDVTVAARPWVQSSSGAVTLNRRKTLSGIDLSETSFTLAPRASKDVIVTVGTAASMYGGIEIVGIPEGTEDKDGVVLGYRLISSLRLNPATPVLSLVAGDPKVTGTGSDRAVVLPVKNAGNTVQPVSGSVRLKSALGTRQRDLDSLRILPGKRVNVLLSSASALKPGSYTATVRLTQGGKTTTLTKKVRVSR
jgi:hypothetical protein